MNKYKYVSVPTAWCDIHRYTVAGGIRKACFPHDAILSFFEAINQFS